MNIDWDILGKWDVMFGISGGIVLVFSGLRWIAKRMGSGRFINLLAWAIVGIDDEHQLIQTTKRILRFVFAAFVWAIIGAFIGFLFVGGFTLFSIAIGVTVSGALEGTIVGAFIGALIGVVIRIIVWPISYWLDSVWAEYRKSKKEQANFFEQQRQRVESQLEQKRQKK